MSEISEKRNSDDVLASVPRYKDLIGNTPLIDISSILPEGVNPGICILAKCEFLNPGFSMKDRIVENILNQAESKGLLKRGGTVVAASSGNTGASVAMVASMKGYKAVIVTSPKCSKEKMDSIRAYGAELIVSPPGVGDDHPESYMNIAKRLASENPEWFDVDQYDNPDNPEAHFRTLGPEIWKQTGGKVTHYVAGSSTGGTLSGAGRYLKSQNSDIKCFLADPYGSIFYEYFTSKKVVKPEPFLVEGVGKGSIPGCLDFGVIDDVIRVTDDDSLSSCHVLAKKEGLMVGGSAGLNARAAVQLALTLKEPAVIVTILCDLGIKYLTKIFNPEWIKENSLNIKD